MSHRRCKRSDSSFDRTRTHATEQLRRVFKGIDVVNSETCVIKVLKPVAPKKVKRGVKILRNLTGGANVVALRDVVRDPFERCHSLVMEHVENVEWRVLFGTLSELDVKYYPFQLFKMCSRQWGFFFVRALNWWGLGLGTGVGFREFERDYAPRCEAGERDNRSQRWVEIFFCGGLLLLLLLLLFFFFFSLSRLDRI